MIGDSVFDRLEDLANRGEVDELALNKQAIQIGSDLEGLRMLVDRYGRSNNVLLVRAVTLPLAGAPWEIGEPDDRLYEIVIRFVSTAGRSADAGTLTGCATALQGLNARTLLLVRSDMDRETLGEFLLHCLHHRDLNVLGVCLHLMGHLSADDRLKEILLPETFVELLAQLRYLKVEAGAEFSEELEVLRDVLGEI